MEKSYRIVSLRGGSNVNSMMDDNRFARDGIVDDPITSGLSNYITLLLQFRTDIKLYHWKTKSFAHHKISDEFLDSIDYLSDKLVEAISGFYNIRPIMSGQTISIRNISEVAEMIEVIRSVGAELKKPSLIMENSDIANIRDELLGSMDKTLYLLSFN
jgi:DNA-binding ferritin-like protein